MTASPRDLIGAIRAQRRRVERAERDINFDDPREIERYQALCAEQRRRQKRLVDEDKRHHRRSSIYVKPDISEQMKVAAYWEKVRARMSAHAR